MRIILATFILWLVIDGLYTNMSGIRGFSLFFVSDTDVGRLNKANFKGVYGGGLHDFKSVVSIGAYGERNSSEVKCNSTTNIIFLSDSTTAGFEVNDDQTFVSNINNSCGVHGYSGINFGVRAHDTHMVVSLYKQKKMMHHKKVIYLITANDFYENIDEGVYPDFTKRFGRIFDNQLHQFQEDHLHSFI
jgi:hypothetical protein